MRKILFFILSVILLSTISTLSVASKVSMVPSIDSMTVCKESFTNQLIKVTNIGPVTDSYKLASDSDMLTFAGCDRGSISNNEVVLAAGESASCSVFINPVNGTESRPYPVAVKTSSLHSSDSSSAVINVDVLSCNAVSLSTQGSIKACARDKFSTTVIVKNVGKLTETFNLSANAPGAFSQNPVTLSAGQPIVVNFEASYRSVSSNKIKFIAKSMDSFASAEGVLDVAVNECFTFATSLKSATDVACLRKPAPLTLEINNTGEKPDVYIIDEQTQVSINVSDNYVLNITAAPREAGKFKTTVSVKSVGSDTTKKVSTDLNVKECGVVSIVPSQAKAFTCKGDEFVYSVDVKNLGNVTDSYNISSTMGLLSADKLSLGPGESKRVDIGVNTTTLAENKTYGMSVSVSAGTLKQTANVSLEVGVCHSADLKIIPQSLNVCMPEKAEFKIDLKNTGRKPETFSLFAAGKQIAKGVLIPVNASESMNFTADYANETGLYKIDIRAVSKDVDTKTSGALVVNDFKTCYGGEVKPKESKKDITPTNRSLEELQVRNTGLRTLNYIMQVVGPSWMAIGISNITLEPNETEKLYLYIAPPFGTRIGNYDTRIIAISEKGTTSSADFVANVVETTTTLKSLNVTTTLKPLNVTTTTLPAAPSGQRNLIVIGIILAVAAVLILRYIFAG